MKVNDRDLAEHTLDRLASELFAAEAGRQFLNLAAELTPYGPSLLLDVKTRVLRQDAIWGHPRSPHWPLPDP